MMATRSWKNLLDVLWPEGANAKHGQVFALLDAARDRRIYPMLRRRLLNFSCLYAGEIAPELAEAAPLSRCHGAKTLPSRSICWSGAGGTLGGCSSSRQPSCGTCRHFRRFLLVSDERGQSLVFRFYDPRVLRVYLPTCNREEAEFIFGPIARFVSEDEDSTRSSCFGKPPRVWPLNASGWMGSLS